MIARLAATAPPAALLAGVIALAAALWALGAVVPRRARGVARGAAWGGALLAAGALTWWVVARNRAGLALPAGAVSPAIAGWRAALTTFAWAVAAAQALTLRPGRPPLAELPGALVALALIVWPRLPVYATLARGGPLYGADARSVLLLGAALAASTLALRGGLALLLTSRAAPLARPDWLLLGAGALLATVALALLARHLAAAGHWPPAASWLVALSAAHALALAGAAARRGRARPPAVIAVAATTFLLAYVARASLGRIPGA
ncbi:MAG TPA: hypothetical protein VFW96_25415 [Thermomicrobiales bacterium]|nr:hypothetical protein [Thermomicrobiales bacterium]